MTTRETTVRVCTAHNKRGLPCQRPACPGSNVCHYHGGAALASKFNGRPPSHGMFRYRVPESWRAAYDTAVNDPDILSLTPEIGVMKAAIADFLDTCVGKDFTPESREHLKGYLDGLSKLTERDAKRKYQESIVQELLAKQVQAEAAILQRLLSEHLDATTAERVAAEFADLVNQASGVSASVQV